MGKALYRKYRSKTLDEVIGQKHITDTLQRAIKLNKVSHAYLFTGPRGVGKTSVARLLAHAVNKLPYDEETQHLDIIEIDAASNRRIDEIRELRDKVHIAPAAGTYKVYIIDEVHMLTREAFNALLKTLEEPPSHAIFILATTELHKVPDTIVSRTQKFTFKSIEPEDATAHLRSIADDEKIKISDAALQLIALHGRGSFRDSISMLDQMMGFAYDTIEEEHVAALLGVPQKEGIEKLIAALKTNDTEALFSSLSQLRARGATSAQTAQALIAYLRSKIVANTAKIDSRKSILLMKSLLPLTQQSSFEALEIELLQAIDYTQPTAAASDDSDKKVAPAIINSMPTLKGNEAAPHMVAPTKAEKVTTEENTSSVTSKSEPVVTDIKDAPLQPADGAEWTGLVKAIKSRHNTLHGVVRMAEIIEDSHSLTMNFKFEFHKKQLSQQKNLQLLRQVILEHYGYPKELILNVVDVAKNSAPAQEEKASEPKVNALENVSNIFGGAELLES